MAAPKRKIIVDDEIAQQASPKKKQRQTTTAAFSSMLGASFEAEGVKPTQPEADIIVTSPKAKNLIQPMAQQSRDQSMTPIEDNANENKENDQLNVDIESEVASESIGVQADEQITQQQQFKRLPPQLLLDIQMLKNGEAMKKKYHNIAVARIKDDRFTDILKANPEHDKYCVNLCDKIYDCNRDGVQNKYKLGKFLVELKDTFYADTGKPENYFYTECERLFPFKTTESEKKANRGVVRECYKLGVAASLKEALKMYV